VYRRVRETKYTLYLSNEEVKDSDPGYGKSVIEAHIETTKALIADSPNLQAPNAVQQSRKGNDLPSKWQIAGGSISAIFYCFGTLAGGNLIIPQQGGNRRSWNVRIQKY
jgi:hypothetical protein